MKILASVFGNLYTDQRVEKVCGTLYEKGHNVELIGNTWGGAPELQRPYPVHRISISSKNLKLGYPEHNLKLYFELKKRITSDTILMANDLDSLLPNYLISKKHSIPLIFDSHEIYTEMPSINGRFTQKIWRLLEKKILPNLKYMMTASNSYAAWFAAQYHLQKPVVVQNFPLRVEHVEVSLNNPNKIILYQGVINPSRGLDKMIEAMPFIHNAQLWIAGDGPKLKEYHNLVNSLELTQRVQFLGKLPPKELREITKKADLGISIEENNGLSYLYSLPNKISDYIQMRVPVLTSNFPEMKDIVDSYGVGEVIESHKADEISKKVNLILGKGKGFYQENLEIASGALCWENEERKLISLVERVEEDRLQP